MTESAKRAQLLRDGYCLFAQILDEPMLRRLREATERVIQAQSEDHLRAHRSQGSLIDARSEPFLAQLVSHKKSLAALAELGFRIHYQQAAARSSPLLAPGLVGMERPGELHGYAATTIPDVLPGRHTSGKRLSARDPPHPS